MPLDPVALSSGLEAVASDPPGGPSACADAWADAVESWATGIVPASTTVALAAATLAGALTAAFESGAAAAPMETAFVTFAASVGAGMAAAGYTATPPPAQVGFSAQFSGPYPPSHAVAADAVTNLIDAWMRTGLATLAAPPNTVVPWS